MTGIPNRLFFRLRIMRRLKTAVIGCGAISDIYLHNLTTRFGKTVEVTGCCAKSLEHARQKAEQYGITPLMLNEILEDDSIELVVNLTPPEAHYDIIKKCLCANKHVYTEKTIASSWAQSRELSNTAKRQGLYLASAPDTFLGEALQTARHALDAGIIGQVTGFMANFNRDGSYFYERLAFTIRPEAGIGYDIGIYYITALLSLLGSAAEVVGKTITSRPIRTRMLPKSGEIADTYTILNENIMTAIVIMKNGAVGTLQFNGDTAFPSKKMLYVFGTKGILQLPDPDMFGGPVYLLTGTGPGGAGNKKKLAGSGRYKNNSRGLGVADMAYAIITGRRPRADTDIALHAIEMLDKITLSSNCGSKQFITTNMQRPVPMREQEPWMKE